MSPQDRSQPVKPDRTQLADAIGQRHPYLTSAEFLKYADILFNEIIQSIKSGKQLGFFERRPDGTVDISVLRIDKVVATATSTKKHSR